MSLSEQAANLLALIPETGSIGNVTLRKNYKHAAEGQAGILLPRDYDAEFATAKAELLAAGLIKLGRGKGGSVKRVSPVSELAASEEFIKVDETRTVTKYVAAPITTEEFQSRMNKKCVKCGSIERYESGDCIPCTNKRCRRYFNANKEKCRVLADIYNRTHREKMLRIHAKYRAGRDKVPFNLDDGDIRIPRKCPVLGISLYRGEKRMIDNSPTLHRLRPRDGYVKGNVEVISYKANRIICDGTLDEHKKVIRYMKRREL